ncbi:MAG TPA: hypothetical protein VEH49_03920, partial [Methylomirabilota bacterium]|nr:hypothetical protein [Methylomirabilota bacterium]
VVLTGFGYLGAAVRDAAATEPRRRTQVELLLLAAVASLLMLRVTLPLWNLLPKLTYLQFPWRWLLPLAVPFAWFAAGAFARRRLRWVAVACAVVVLPGTAAFLVPHAWWDTEDFPVLRQAIAAGAGYEGTDEYDPVGDDRTDLPQHAPQARLLFDEGDVAPGLRASVEVERWAPGEKLVRVKTSLPVKLALRVLDYPAWRVELNGVAVAPSHPDRTRQIIVPLPAGDSRVSVRFTRTPDRTAAAAVSLFTVCVFFWLYRRSTA